MRIAIPGHAAFSLLPQVRGELPGRQYSGIPIFAHKLNLRIVPQTAEVGGDKMIAIRNFGICAVSAAVLFSLYAAGGQNPPQTPEAASAVLGPPQQQQKDELAAPIAFIRWITPPLQRARRPPPSLATTPTRPGAPSNSRIWKVFP